MTAATMFLAGVLLVLFTTPTTPVTQLAFLADELPVIELQAHRQRAGPVPQSGAG